MTTPNKNRGLTSAAALFALAGMGNIYGRDETPDPRRVIVRAATTCLFNGDKEAFEWLMDHADANFPAPKQVRACRKCGCTEMSACATPIGPCFWVSPNLCSGCIGA